MNEEKQEALNRVRDLIFSCLENMDRVRHLEQTNDKTFEIKFWGQKIEVVIK